MAAAVKFTLSTISIHALREEGDTRKLASMLWQRVFLSTPSARRATPIASILTPLESNFYPRPPRGGRPAAASRPGQRTGISIHALREEGDHPARFADVAIKQFLSTPSARRAT